MGALITLSWLTSGRGKDAGIAGAIVQAPPFKVVAEIPRWKVAAARLLSRAWPTLGLGSDLDPSTLSRDPAVGERYMSDPLVHKTCSPRLYTELTGTAARLLAHPVDYGIPTLFLHGEDDRLAGIAGTRDYFERSPLAKKKLVTFPAARHELHNDIADDQWREIASFMASGT
jgi:alpha-beta hydrolase superfamily lysophospholipase